MITQSTHKNPAWWNSQHDSAWERTKAAFKRDWDQTKSDLGRNEPDTNQKAGNTIRQAAGKETIPPRHTAAFEDVEPAYRFGYGARSYYAKDYPEWDDKLETRLREEWELTDATRKSHWDEDREAIRYGWDYTDK